MKQGLMKWSLIFKECYEAELIHWGDKQNGQILNQTDQ